jgi:hypothetical protein
MLVSVHIVLLCLTSLGFINPGAVAQELEGPSSRRTAIGPAALTVEQERAWAAKPGSCFKECAACPVMIVIPAGKFIMGVRFDTLGFRVARTIKP